MSKWNSTDIGSFLNIFSKYKAHYNIKHKDDVNMVIKITLNRTSELIYCTHTIKLRTDVIRNHASTLAPSSQCKHDKFHQLPAHTSTTTLPSNQQIVSQPSENTALQALTFQGHKFWTDISMAQARIYEGRMEIGNFPRPPPKRNFPN